MAAIRSGPSATALERIAAEGFDAKARDARGESPVVAAASAGRLDILDALLKAGALADAQAQSGLCALAAAAMNGHLACVHRLLTAGATVDLSCGRSRSTALLHAARNGHRSVCEALLEAGADAHRADAYGETAEAAAHRFEKDGRLYSSDFAQWSAKVAASAAAIGAEPKPKSSLFPLKLRDDIAWWHHSTDPTKRLWRPGIWMHQKRPATEAVLQQERPRPFSTTGYGSSSSRVQRRLQVRRERAGGSGQPRAPRRVEAVAGPVIQVLLQVLALLQLERGLGRAPAQNRHP